MAKNQDKINKIFKKVLKEIKPSDAENKETIKKINNITNELKNIVSNDVEILVTGSVSRGTNLKGNSDIDIFLLFKVGTTKSELTKLGLSYGKALVKKKTDTYEIKYAEHPYTRVYLDSLGIKADIVPALKIQNAENLATAVDRTPLHTTFINEKLTSKQKDDVRLLKYFLKAQNIYGAESKTSGFSGYLCEILIYHFSSIKNLFEWSSSLELPVALIPKSKSELSNKELFSKFNSDFIVLDPVDENRNVAAALSKESLSKFILASRKFIGNPSEKQFYGIKFSDSYAKSYLKNFLITSGLETYAITFNLPDKSEEILWPQIKKASSIITDYLKRNELDVYFSLQWIVKNKGIIILIAPKQDKKTRIFKGPEVFNKKAISEFMKSHSKGLGFMFSETRMLSLDTSQLNTIEKALNQIKKNKQLYSHKDINLLKARIEKNTIPEEFSDTLCYEFMKRLSV